jgi:hypothetical protein
MVKRHGRGNTWSDDAASTPCELKAPLPLKQPAYTAFFIARFHLTHDAAGVARAQEKRQFTMEAFFHRYAKASDN